MRAEFFQPFSTYQRFSHISSVIYVQILMLFVDATNLASKQTLELSKELEVTVQLYDDSAGRGTPQHGMLSYLDKLH